MILKIQSLWLVGLLLNIAHVRTFVRGAACEKYISESSDYRLSHDGETGSAHWGLKTKGGYYRTIKKVQSLSDCFEECVKRTKCNSFTYTPNKEKCSMSKRYGATSASKVDSQSVKFCKSSNSIAGFILRNTQSAVSLTSPNPIQTAVGPAPSPSVSPSPSAEAPSPSPSAASPSPSAASPSPSSPSPSSPSPSSPSPSSPSPSSPSPSSPSPSSPSPLPLPSPSPLPIPSPSPTAPITVPTPTAPEDEDKGESGGDDEEDEGESGGDDDEDDD